MTNNYAPAFKLRDDLADQLTELFESYGTDDTAIAEWLISQGWVTGYPEGEEEE